MPNLGLMAWNAVTSLDPDEIEALGLSCRHEVDLSLVLGLAPADVGALLDRARQSLERALAAEIVIKKSRSCAFRAELLTGWTGVTSPDIRDRMLEHAFTCPVCEPHLPRNVSPARVFAQLPAPELSSLARLEILEFFRDPRMSAYREFAASRAAEATGFAFLLPPAASRPPAPARNGPPATSPAPTSPAPTSPAPSRPAPSCPVRSRPAPTPSRARVHHGTGSRPQLTPFPFRPAPVAGGRAGQVPPRRGPGLHRLLGPRGSRPPVPPSPPPPRPRRRTGTRSSPPPASPATPRTGPTARSPRPGPAAGPFPDARPAPAAGQRPAAASLALAAAAPPGRSRARRRRRPPRRSRRGRSEERSARQPASALRSRNPPAQPRRPSPQARPGRPTRPRLSSRLRRSSSGPSPPRRPPPSRRSRPAALPAPVPGRGPGDPLPSPPPSWLPSSPSRACTAYPQARRPGRQLDSGRTGQRPDRRRSVRRRPCRGHAPRISPPQRAAGP